MILICILDQCDFVFLLYHTAQNSFP